MSDPVISEILDHLYKRGMLVTAYAMEGLVKERDHYQAERNEHEQARTALQEALAASEKREQALSRELEQERYHRRAVQESEQALAAHMLAIMDARDSKRGDTLENMLAVLNGGPSCLSSLSKRDLIKQAEALEEAALEAEVIGQHWTAMFFLRPKAKGLRQQAKVGES